MGERLKRHRQVRPARFRKTAVQLDGYDLELLYTGLQSYRVQLLGKRTDEDLVSATNCDLLACRLTRANRED